MPRSTQQRSALWMLAAGAVLAGLTAMARRGVSEPERRLNAAINHLPDSLAPVAWVPMQFGALASPLTIGAAAYWRTRRRAPAVPVAAAGFTAWVAAKVVKELVGRGRPFDHEPDTRLRMATKTDGSLGFVSGHAAVATTVAGVLGRSTTPGRAALLYGLAGVTGSARIYAGAHWPLDVLGGFALGVLVSEGVAVVQRAAGGRGSSRKA